MRERQSVDRIAEQFDLSQASIYAVLAYYYDHRDEIDAKTAADDAWVEEQLRDTPPALREKLNAQPSGADGE